MFPAAVRLARQSGYPALAARCFALGAAKNQKRQKQTCHDPEYGLQYCSIHRFVLLVGFRFFGSFPALTLGVVSCAAWLQFQPPNSRSGELLRSFAGKVIEILRSCGLSHNPGKTGETACPTTKDRQLTNTAAATGY
jgi:hypothetical protein